MWYTITEINKNGDIWIGLWKCYTELQFSCYFRLQPVYGFFVKSVMLSIIMSIKMIKHLNFTLPRKGQRITTICRICSYCILISFFLAVLICFIGFRVLFFLFREQMLNILLAITSGVLDSVVPSEKEKALGGKLAQPIFQVHGIRYLKIYRILQKD